MIKRLVLGRIDTALTIHVPFDCPNNCVFCINKKYYSNKNISAPKVIESIKDITNRVPLGDVVISGGEPTANVKLLETIIRSIKSPRIFINTTLLNNTYEEFREFLKKGLVTGISVSRHTDKYTSDLQTMHNLATDQQILALKKFTNVRVNVTLTDTTSINGVIERWSDNDIVVNFRKDFTKTNTETLHDHTVCDSIFISNSKYLGSVLATQCDVCDSRRLIFDFNDTNTYYFHRGLENTSIELDNMIEVNDIIIMPDGTICYDWDGKILGSMQILF